MFEQAVNKFRHAPSAYMIGNIYFTTPIENRTTRQQEKAFQWYEKALNLGETDARYMLALLTYFGYGTQQSYEKAIWHIKQIHPNDFNKSEVVNKQILWIPYLLSGAYANGWGVQKNEAKALNYFKMGAEVGDNLCMANLASIYMFGQCGVSIDRNKSFELAQKAISFENPYFAGAVPGYAYAVLSIIYGDSGVANEVNVRKDLQKALKYANVAIETGIDWTAVKNQIEAELNQQNRW